MEEGIEIEASTLINEEHKIQYTIKILPDRK